MLEVCPSIAGERPSCEIHPLSIGGRDDPVRLVFTARARARRRRRHPRPRRPLPAGRERGRASSSPTRTCRGCPSRGRCGGRADLADAAEAWLIAGGPHHTGLTTQYGARCSPTSPRSPGSSCVVIDERTRTATSRRSSAGTRRTTTSPAVSEGGSDRALGAAGARARGEPRDRRRGARRPSPSATRARVDRAAGVMAIKPSGVAVRRARPGVDRRRRPRQRRRRSTATLRPSSDTPTHLVLYRRFEAVGGDRPHALAVGDRLGAGGPRDPVLRHDACRPLPRAGAGHARPHRRGDRRRLRGAHRRRDRGDVRAAAGSTRSRCRPCSSARTGRSSGGRDEAEAVENATALEAVASMALELARARAGAALRSCRSCSSATSGASTAPAAYYGQPR